MEQWPRLKARIASLHAFRDLVRALRALAASRVQEAQGALVGIRGYVEAVEDSIAEGVGLLSPPHSFEPSSQIAASSVLVVVCSEHGFTGAFNELLLDKAQGTLAPAQRLAIIGRRGALLATERNMTPAWSQPMATHIGGVPGVARRIADNIAAASTAQIVYAAFRRGGQATIEAKQILPLDPGLLARSARRGPPLHHMAPEVLLQRLANEYLFAEITRAVMESMASENSARLQAMETADHNIGDKLDALGREEQVLRQEGITSELIDVVTGAEAILGTAT